MDETIKNALQARREEIFDAFKLLVEAEINFYNKTCTPGFQITNQDLINYLQSRNKK